MKLSEYAHKLGITYRTAWEWYRAGRLEGYQMDTGTIIITEDDKNVRMQTVAIYARESSLKNRKKLQRQIEQLTIYCQAKGWNVDKVVKEIGSGVSDERPLLLDLLNDDTIKIIVVERKETLTCFSFNYIQNLLVLQGRRIEVFNLADEDKDEMLNNLQSTIDAVCSQLYSLQEAKQKSLKIRKVIEIE
ncbi:MAG: hypothetical protein B6242_00815 [Anaerolineaceae bacterium 4572_78]|nr:MAG: hypothetical protein B6242_00815 [Anaerolineaceae bacterium 4572_78]